MKIEDNLTPELVDNDKILVNSQLSKKLRKIYIRTIKDWYDRRFQEF